MPSPVRYPRKIASWWLLVALLAASAGAAAEEPFLPLPAIDVALYQVELAVEELSRAPIDAVVRIDFKAVRTIDMVRFNVEPEKIAIDSVRDAEGHDLSYTIDPGVPNAHGLTGTLLSVSLPAPIAAGAAGRIDIGYRISVQPSSDPRGIFFHPDHYDSRIVSSRSWPYYARYWLPSNDHPSDGAAFRFVLKVPAGVVAAANGALTSISTSPEGSVYVWDQMQPIPTYAAQVTIGELSSTESLFCFDSTTGARTDCDSGAAAVAIQFFFPANLPNRALFESEIDKAVEALAYFSATFGRYRFSKAGFVGAPHPFSMESASVVTLVRPGDAVHEIVHHWWGNAVQIRTWGDFWISEGLTTYFTGFFDEVRTGVNTACMTTGRKLNVAPDHDPMNLFNLDPYCVGAAAIDDYRRWSAVTLGRDMQDPEATRLFLEVFRAVYEELAFQSTDTRGFTRSLSRATLKVLRGAGVDVTSSFVDEALQQWEQRWFTGFAPPEGSRRRRAVGR